MKFLAAIGLSVLVSVSVAQGQGTNDVLNLQKQLKQLQEQFEQVTRAQQAQIEALTRKLESLTPAESPSTSTKAISALEKELAAEMAASSTNHSEETLHDHDSIAHSGLSLDISVIGTFAAGTSTADDIHRLQPGGHDPNQRGFTVQGLETSFYGAVDPYFDGRANLLFAVDPDGESYVELEEAWLQTLSLPGRIQIRAGQYLTEFGRHNTLHPHGWATVDNPLVNARLVGPDGLRNPGARLSWLAPTPFFSELTFGVQNSQGETAASFRSGGHSHGEEDDEELPLGFRHPDNDRGVRNVDDLLLSARYAASFDLNEDQTVLLGTSAVTGPNSSGQSGETDTQLFGADFHWKWKSPSHESGFPFVSWQTEGILRRYRAGAFDWDEDGNLGDNDGNGFADEGVLIDPATGAPAVLSREVLLDYGFYSQISYGFRRGWVAGLRYDYLGSDLGDYERRSLTLADNAGGGSAVGPDLRRSSRWRVSPNLTWYPSEFSKLRLQYNYDDRRYLGVDHSVWLQFEFLLGAHGAHKY